MTGRKCSTCKHYEAAPIWRKGWCRNPLLYSPQQSHLVGEDDLDCERGMGNYWEPSAGGSPVDELDVSGFQERISEAFAAVPSSPSAVPVTTQTGQPVFAVSGSSGYGNDQGVPDPTGGQGGRGGSGDRQLNYYAEDRYWTDYLRIAAPILGVILMVVLFWLWASSFLGDDDDGTNLASATGTTTLPTIGASPTGSTATVTGGATATPAIIRTTTAPAQNTEPSGGNEEPTPTEEIVTTPDELFAGANVVIANTGGTGANMRAEPSTSAEIIATLLDGTELTITGESVEAEGFVWWPVTGADGDGYVVADYLALNQ